MDKFDESEERRKRWEERNPIEQFWTKIPEKSRAMVEVIWRIPYNFIVAIDPEGDEYEECPHIYFPFDLKQECGYAELKLNGQIAMYNPVFEDRLKFFPDSFPSGEDANRAVLP